MPAMQISPTSNPSIQCAAAPRQIIELRGVACGKTSRRARATVHEARRELRSSPPRSAARKSSSAAVRDRHVHGRPGGRDLGDVPRHRLRSHRHERRREAPRLRRSRSLPGANGFVISRVGSGRKRADVFVTGTGRILIVSSQGQAVASGNGQKGGVWPIDAEPPRCAAPLLQRLVATTRCVACLVSR